MRSLLILGACLLSTAALSADAPPDLTLTFSAAEQAAWDQIEPLFLQCTADVAYDLPAGGANCRNLHKFLAAWAAKVKGAATPLAGAKPQEGDGGK